MNRRSENHKEESASSMPTTAIELGDPQVATLDRRHQIECEVHNRLTALPGIDFSSLVIRRIANGVCLEGVVEADSDDTDVSAVARTVAGVENVLNHLVFRQRRAVPPKG